LPAQYDATFDLSVLSARMPHAVQSPAMPNVSIDSSSVSVVIPGKNCAHTLKQCLESFVYFLDRRLVEEIIFVNDCSTDSTEDICRQHPVTLLQGEGKGPGHARNIGWKAAKTEYVWFVDSDCVAEPGALRPLLERFRLSDYAAVGGSYGIANSESLLARLIHEEIVQRHLSFGEEVTFLGSFNVMVRRDVLSELDGFNEEPAFVFMEDAELTYRLLKEGYKLGFSINSRVQHYHPTGLIDYLTKQAMHGERRVALYKKYPKRVAGDSYSSLWEYFQPALVLMFWAMVALWIIFPVGPMALAVGIGCVLLHVPYSYLIVKRCGLSYLAFLPMSMVRSLARGFGALLGVIRHIVLG
jgi:glycosyltransferase involved in cell wall biosynthesis